MPQLDTNTFIYQYTGIITTLILVYVLLSYIVLPLLLRALIIRASFLTSKAAVLATRFLTPVEQNFFNTNSPSIIFTVFSQLAHATTKKIINTQVLINYFFSASRIESLNSINNTTMYLFIIPASINYIILFLMADNTADQETQ